MFKKICLIGLIAAAFSFAQEEGETYIRNICDTLPKSATPLVELKMTRVDVTQWYGSKDLSKKDSSSVKHYESYEAVKPFRNKVLLSLPVSITAACAETKYNLYKYVEWDQSGAKWDLNTENDDYATVIYDINMIEFPGYDASNAYNILAMKKGSLPTNNAYSSGELLVSKTFELQFDWWYTIAAYKTETTKTDSSGKTVVTTSWKMNYANTMDSASSVNSAVAGLKVPEDVSKIQFQQFHVVLSDPNKKIVPYSSSSVPESSSSSVASSSSEAASSSSIASSSSEEKSSSSEASSSSVEESSSSEGTTVIGRVEASPRAFKAREIRRLDGSKIKAGEALVPGVYYVKGMDGRWKKQVELP